MSVDTSVLLSVQVLRLDVTFQEIMRQYRHQPQAKSHVRTRPQGSHYMQYATVCRYCVQVYRSVLLNSGPHKTPQPDSPSDPTLGKTSEGTSPAALQGKETPVDHILYRADIPVGSRGDIIQFYNKLFIGFIKDYVLRFSPNDAEVGALVGDIDVTCLYPRLFLPRSFGKKLE